MVDIDKVSGVATGDIDKVSGVSKANISKITGASYPIGTTAAEWIVGAPNGLVITSAGADVTQQWTQLVDLSATNNIARSMAYGEDASGNSRWLFISSQSGDPGFFINASLDKTVSGNWTEIDIEDGLVHSPPQNSGPCHAWGDGYWVATGNDRDNNGDSDTILYVSTDGGAAWNTVVVGNDSDTTGRVVCYKDNTTFFMTVYDKIWRTTVDPSIPGAQTDPADETKWYMRKELAPPPSGNNVPITAMAYNPDYSVGEADGMWIAVRQNGEAYTSTDDWGTASSAIATGATKPTGLVYCRAGIGSSLGMWVLCGHDGEIYTSSDDGSSWTSRDSDLAASVDIQAIATDHTTIVAVGTQSSITTSTDGVNWTERDGPEGMSNKFDSIACNIIGAGLR